MNGSLPLGGKWISPPKPHRSPPIYLLNFELDPQVVISAPDLSVFPRWFPLGPLFSKVVCSQRFRTVVFLWLHVFSHVAPRFAACSVHSYPFSLKLIPSPSISLIDNKILRSQSWTAGPPELTSYNNPGAGEVKKRSHWILGVFSLTR